MISFSGDEELLEALGHVTDGVLRVYVELGDIPPAALVPHHNPHQLVTALSGLLAGFTHCGGHQGTAGDASGTACSAESASERSGEEKEREKDENEETSEAEEQQDVRRFIVDTANAFLEPLG